MHWMSVKLPDNFQMREHSWPCRFHIILQESCKIETFTEIESLQGPTTLYPELSFLL
jgi:hypothetical protein